MSTLSKHNVTFLCAALLSSALAFSAFAQDQAAAGSVDFPGTFSGSVAMTSDYVFRGISQSDENPAVQGSIDYNLDLKDGFGLYLGTWASSVDFNDSNQASAEFDYYGGVNYKLDKWSFDMGAVYYAYPGADNSLDYDYWEGKFGAGYDLGIVALDGEVYWTPDNFGGTDDAEYYKLGASAPLPYGFTLDGHVGRQQFKRDDIKDYTDWAVGLAYNLKGLDLKAEYTDTNLSNNKLADSRAVFTVSKSF